ncbi:MAG: methyltransferase, partial [Chloroflexi bacterium]|nr:methyltransferase [Chloroflexota bacterium]
MHSDLLQSFINKQVDFRFSGQPLTFALSQSLFSSFDIDVGSRALLKTIAKTIDLSQVNNILDVGCGVGVLGLSLQKATPSAQVVLQDRDALAVAFTQMNAQLNGLEQATVRGELGVGNGRYDLIVSNLPGKAGEPVLQQMLGEIVASLSENGRSAIVIVNPLAQLIHTTLQQLGCDILLQERGKMHTVFHFSGGELESEAGDGLLSIDRLRPYIRGQYPFKAAKFSVTLQTTYGLPEFDTVGYHSSLTIN